MHKIILLSAVPSLGLMSCGKGQETPSETTSTSEKTELDAPNVAEPKQKEEANPKSQTSQGGQKTIVGDAVIMREGPTTESAKLGNFKKGERVSVLEKKESSTLDEVVAVKAFSLSSLDGKKKVEVNKGAALKVKEWLEGDGVVVIYKGIEGDIGYDLVEDTGIWYKVRRSDGKEGWVLGKFIQ